VYTLHGTKTDRIEQSSTVHSKTGQTVGRLTDRATWNGTRHRPPGMIEQQWLIRFYTRRPTTGRTSTRKRRRPNMETACSDDATSHHATDMLRCQQAQRNAGQAIRSPLALPTKTDASTDGCTDADGRQRRLWLGVRIASLFKPPDSRPRQDRKQKGTSGRK
jgi:hypothetical protein